VAFPVTIRAGEETRCTVRGGGGEPIPSGHQSKLAAYQGGLTPFTADAAETRDDLNFTRA